MKITLIIFVMFNSWLAACHSQGTVSPNEPPPQKGVSFYLITSPVDLYTNATALDYASITLATSPLISYDQLNSYSTSNHTFRFQPTVRNSLLDLLNTTPLSGRAFAVTVDGVVVYTGIFIDVISSFSPAYPFVALDKNILSSTSPQQPLDLMVSFRAQISPNGDQRIDLRNDSRLVDRLKLDNKLQ